MPSTPYFLQAGPLRVRYENGFLRYITHDDAEILRMIYFAVRDHNWQTAAFTITDEHIDQTADSFRISYVWHTDDLGIQLTGQVAIEGDLNGTISVDFYGKALNSFQKNRIGLCVLHPIDGVIGQPAQVIDPNGHVASGHFPVSINPYQPFISIQTLRWRPASGTTWQLDFSGEVFETEDQRNWTDDSFKTYSTPSTQPFPVAVALGDEFRQRVVFERSQPILSAPAAVHELSDRHKLLTDLTPTIPRLGVGQWAGGPPLTETEAKLLRELRLSHLRTDIFFRLPNWQTLLTNAIADAQKLAVPLELAVFFNNHPLQELQLLQHVLEANPVAVQSMLIFQADTLRTSNDLLQTLVPVLRTEWSGQAGLGLVRSEMKIGGGTDDNFVEWNRHRFAVDRVDFVTYSINPQIHAFDDLTLLENIAGQTETALSAQQLGDGKPIHISPITLLPRYTTLAGTATERLTAPADPRQTTEFGADWTRRSLTALANAGVVSVTYYQTHGPGGLVDGDTVHPVFHALKDRRST